MTKKALPILCMGIIAFYLLYREHPHAWPRYFLFLYGWGLLFETLTNNLWNYCDDLGKTALSIPRIDIHLFFPFGWIFLASATSFFSSCYWQYVVFGGLIGSAMEIVFYNLNYWTYADNEKFMRRYPLFKPKFTVLGVHWQIIVSYFILVGSANWYTMEKLLS